MYEGVLGGEEGAHQEGGANTGPIQGLGQALGTTVSGLAGGLDNRVLPFGQTEEDPSSEEPH